MIRCFRIQALLLFALLVPFAARAEAQQQGAPGDPTVVIVVRHAEKEAEGRDPALTEAGAARARSLLRVAGDAQVAAVFTSNYRRTQDTGRPLADSLGIPLSVVPVDPATAREYPAQVARAVLETQRGKTVLVVSHSNTVPAIVRALGGGEVGEISEAEYDHLFVVVIPASGPARTIKAMYGLPRP